MNAPFYITMSWFDSHTRTPIRYSYTAKIIYYSKVERKKNIPQRKKNSQSTIEKKNKIDRASLWYEQHKSKKHRHFLISDRV